MKKEIVLIKSWLVVFALLVSFQSFSNDGHEEEQHNEAAAHSNVEHSVKKYKDNPGEVIMNHVKDGNEWHILTLHEGTPEEHHVSVPLPVILYDGAFKFFWSSKLAHGHEYEGYVMQHGDLISLDNKKRADMFDLVKGNTSTANVFYDFSITKNVFTILFVSLILLIVFIRVAKSYKKGLAPSGMAKFLEPIILFVRDEIAIPNFQGEKYKKFMPFLLSLFFFIWFSNMMGLIPFFPFGANMTGNISVTFVLALITMIIVNVSAGKDYWGHIFWMPGVPVPVKILLAPIELVGLIAKPFALMIRLFANITAGHIVVLSLVGIIFIFEHVGGAAMAIPLALFISVLELLVAFLQAFVFTMLAALFIGMATEEHHHDHAH